MTIVYFEDNPRDRTFTWHLKAHDRERHEPDDFTQIVTDRDGRIQFDECREWSQRNGQFYGFSEDVWMYAMTAKIEEAVALARLGRAMAGYLGS